MKKRNLALVGLALLAVVGCKKKEGCTDPLATNYDAEADKNCCCEYAPVEEELEVPSTYVFEDGSGNSTVNYSGQIERLAMLSEMITYLKTANTAGTVISATDLKSMYANNGFSWTDSESLGLTGSTKQLKNKTAYSTADGSSDTGVQDYFEDLMDSIATISATTTTGNENGATGVDGVWPNDGVKGPYLMDGNGNEHTQLIEKGLMCAVFMSQITVNYLGTLSDDDNTTAVDAGAGKFYTNMEHHWDEAYGYFTDAIDYPNNGTDRFWGKYADGRETVLGSATKLSNAFRKGRSAISAGDMSERDAQITIIRNELEKVCAGTAIHYLNSAKANLANNTARNHSLSEAWGFLNGLRYGYNAINGTGMSTAHVDMCINMLGTDFNNVTTIQLNNVIDHIATHTGLDGVKNDL